MQNNKFAFLKPGDPFNPYYVATVIANGGKPPAGSVDVAESSAKISGESTVKPVKKVAAGVMPVEPPKPQYIVNRPAGAQPLDMDVIMLTAQFVARNGRSFLTGLANRESKNPMFDFLRPTHFLFSYFTSLVDAYSKCLAPNEELKQRLLKESDDRLRTLTRIQQYASFVRERDRTAHSKKTVEDAERNAMMTIDWHDFVCVETIGFDDEESLPKPQDLVAEQKPKPAPPKEEEEARGEAEAEEGGKAAAAELAEPEPVARPAPAIIPDRLVRRDYTPQVDMQLSYTHYGSTHYGSTHHGSTHQGSTHHGSTYRGST